MRAGDVAEVSKPAAGSLGLTPELGVLHGVAERSVMSHEAGGSRGGRDFLQQHREQFLVGYGHGCAYRWVGNCLYPPKALRWPGGAFGTVRVNRGAFSALLGSAGGFRGSQLCSARLSKINRVTCLKILRGHQPPESVSAACSRFLDRAVGEMRSPRGVSQPWKALGFLKGCEITSSSNPTCPRGLPESSGQLRPGWVLRAGGCAHPTAPGEAGRVLNLPVGTGGQERRNS